MNVKHLCMAALAVVSMLGAEASADLSFVANIPTADVLVSRGDEANTGGGGSSQATFGFRNADPGSSDGTRARGQSFNFSAGGNNQTFNISSISVALAGGAGGVNRPDGQLEFTVFEWQGADADDSTVWQTGTGGLDGLEIFRESFAIDSTNVAGIVGTNLVEIAFNTGELQLVDGTDYGFLFNYTLNSTAGLNSDVTIAFDADNNAPDGGIGQLLNTNVSTTGFANAANGVSSTRDLNYFITGTKAIPEPGSASLLLASGLLIAVRRRRSV